MRAVLLAALLTAAAPFAAAPLVAPTPARAQAAAPVPPGQFELERQAILSQAGQFRVRFDMRETVSFRDGYDPLDEHQSGGNEIVRVVYDAGDRISLQHILVMEHEGQSFVIKHWRQDWVYQPGTVLTYTGPNQWTLTAVPEAERRGAWSQTVWQTDDSPRYGGVGKWSFANGMAVWTSAPTWRPLARRDAVRHPVYDRYLGTNRHALTPFGWVHIQDNMKMGPAGGDDSETVAIVQEDVINTYRRWDGYDAGPGDAYWTATSDYWAGVRALWDAAIARSGGVHVEEVAQTGAVTGTPLMDLADKVQAGEISTESALESARSIIETATAQ